MLMTVLEVAVVLAVGRCHGVYSLKETMCIVVASLFSSYYYAQTNRQGVTAFQSIRL